MGYNLLNGILENINNKINIKLNKSITGKIFFKDNISNLENFLLDFNGNSITFEDPKPLNRTFYTIKSSDGESITLAERILPLKNICNFRDIGGYFTKDNRMVKWGYFYRSEHLHELKDLDLEYFKTLNIKYVFDYRSISEVNSNPDVIVSGVKNLNISAMVDSENENLDMVAYMEKFIKGEEKSSPVSMLRSSYGFMPFKNDAYKKLMEVLREDGDFAILQHCTAGKDRTGLGSALILLLLGVDEETIIEDYLKSNEYRKDSNEKLLNSYSKYIKDPNLINEFKGVLSVERSFILESLNRIKERYETYESYFEKEFNIDSKELKSLRDKYLY